MKTARNLSLPTLQPSFPTLPRYQSKAWGTGQNILKTVKQITATLLSSLVLKPEPQIWQKKDAQGNIVWHTYDPITGYRALFDTEQEVRIWLENRYNS
ncbi:conserved hypothetical protein [Planktothrix serta PCC 8927]|uniref:Uncharacterized protein n=1 Tax=Planktothrix serta PCC 8927 TaxID=671068 RepID=A0A7Z9BPY5_9CYAN|nr:hypothetical protein [Planktothrix serta]VXD17065.1 conserved hypothetical protein [Planktothrix serta PCC 8927]